jgi:ketosteroid isomerase-like protein
MHFHLQRCLLLALTTFMLADGAAVVRAAEPTAPESNASAITAASPFIERANNEWEVAIQAGDADALSRPYREDGVFIGPDGNPVRGRSAIRAMYAARAAAKKRIVAATIQSEGRIAASADDVYEWGGGLAGRSSRRRDALESRRSVPHRMAPAAGWYLGDYS